MSAIRITLAWIAVCGFCATDLVAGDYRLHCRKAHGYYAWLDIVGSGSEVTIDANQGYSYEIAKQLKLSEKPLTALRFKLPVSDCKFSTSDAMLVECQSRSVPLGFRGDASVDVTAGQIGLYVTRVTEQSVHGAAESVKTVLVVQAGERTAHLEESFRREGPEDPAEGCVKDVPP